MSIWKRSLAELLGTFWLVFCGCGSALIAASVSGATPGQGIGFLGVSLAFGLTVLTMAFAIGHISGCHLNPAVTIGLTVGRRFPARDVAPYIVAQLIGASVAASALLFIMQGNPEFNRAASSFATNGYGDQSLGHYGLAAAFVGEAVMTAFFVFVILGATDERAPTALAPVAIGLCLALIHLVLIPVTGTSVNPARSFGPALVARGAALDQLWLFCVAPVFGAIVAGVVYPALAGRAGASADPAAEPDATAATPGA